MKYKRFYIVLVAVFAVFFSWSCEGYTDQFNMDKLSTEMELTPSFVGSVAYGGFSIQNILEVLTDSSGIIEQTDDSLIYIFYADTAFSLSADGLIEIPDHVGSEVYLSSEIDIPGWLPGTEFSFYKQEKLDFAIAAEDRIDSVFLKSGSIDFTAFSEFKHGGWLTITSNNVISPNGDTLVQEIEIDKIDGTFSFSETTDLSGYTLLMDEEDGMAYVKIHINLILKKEDAPILADEEAGINLSLRDLEYSAVFGFIAPREITELEQSIDIGFFDNLENIPSIYFANPRFKIGVHNTIGVPLSLDINSFRSRSAVSGEYVDLEFKNDTMMPYAIYAPTIDQIGEEVSTYRIFSVETCNIDEILSNIPDKIDFSFSASTGNPPGYTEQNFILDTSRMSLDVEVMLPLNLSTSRFTMTQPVDIDVSDLLSNIGIIDNVKFILNTTNEWPIGIDLQIYFEDNQGAIIDSLFQDGSEVLIEAAPVNSSGDLDRSRLREYPFIVELGSDQVDDLEGATKMSIKASVSTTDNGSTNVRFYSNYLLNYRLAVDAKFKINTSEL